MKLYDYTYASNCWNMNRNIYVMVIHSQNITPKLQISYETA